MKALIQRVSRANVTIDGKIVGSIRRGYMALIGVRDGDTDDDARQLADKTTNLRIFPDSSGRMNLSILDIGGEILIVPQFTLYADTRKGNRPSFVTAGSPEIAKQLYNTYITAVRSELGGSKVATGRFGAKMQVEIVNDGPVTIELCTDR
ncbi:MAG: D-tyrosyl-tRNA(Tyr) deacylase [Lentisphaerae bacterium]|nr:D-tyrosyl-tRNA(Tyr) deacylase [Lentisphaerota bacterium]